MRSISGLEDVGKGKKKISLTNEVKRAKIQEEKGNLKQDRAAF